MLLSNVEQKRHIMNLKSETKLRRIRSVYLQLYF